MIQCDSYFDDDGGGSGGAVEATWSIWSSRWGLKMDERAELARGGASCRRFIRSRERTSHPLSPRDHLSIRTKLERPPTTTTTTPATELRATSHWEQISIFLEHLCLLLCAPPQRAVQHLASYSHHLRASSASTCSPHHPRVSLPSPNNLYTRHQRNGPNPPATPRQRALRQVRSGQARQAGARRQEAGGAEVARKQGLGCRPCFRRLRWSHLRAAEAVLLGA
ncbi:hypothetical protein IWX49DRAFT_374280 [Phyllosticta citricarpa]